MDKFNLIDEDWIPVVPATARTSVLKSIREVLTNGRQYKRIEDPSPLVVISLHRLLLAVLHRALQGPIDAQDNANWFSNGFDDTAIQNYLGKYQPNFYLFDNDRPFFQVTGDFKAHKTKSPTKARKGNVDGEEAKEPERLTWARLAPEISSGNNKVWFDHTTDENAGVIDAPFLARALVSNQGFDVVSSKTDFVNLRKAFGAAPAYTLVLGNNLHETLCLNLVPYDSESYKADKAVFWEQSEKEVPTVEYMRTASQQERPITGIAHLHSLYNRSVRLLFEEALGGVRYVEYASAELYRRDKNFIDPMIGTVGDKQTEVRFDTEKAFWRDFSALVPQSSTRPRDVAPKVIGYAQSVLMLMPKPQRNRRIQLLVAGQVAGTSKLEMWRAEEYELPEKLISDQTLRSVLDRSLTHAEDVGKVLRRAAFQLLVRLEPELKSRPLEGKKSIATLWNNGRPKTKLQDESALTNRLLNQVAGLPVSKLYWSALETRFSTWLVSLEELMPEQADLEWPRNVYQAARNAWNKTCGVVGQGADIHQAISEAEYAPIFYERDPQGRIFRRSLRSYLWFINPDKKESEQESEEV